MADRTAMLRSYHAVVSEFARLDAEVDHLRALVQALEEECAARQEDGDRLAEAMSDYAAEVTVDCWADCVKEGLHPAHRDGCYGVDDHAARTAHDAMTARYAPGAPDPLPDPVEGDTEALSDQSDVPEAVAAIEAILERNARLERDLYVARRAGR